NVPSQNARVVGKRTDHSLHISLQVRVLGGIFQSRRSRALHPSRIVYTRDGRMLRTKFGTRIKTGVKQNQHGPNVMLRSDGQERINSLLKASRIFIQKDVRKKNPHHVHARVFGPTELFINLLRIKCIGLPHFELVDGGCRNVIGTNEPGLLRVTTRWLWLQSSAAS